MLRSSVLILFVLSLVSCAQIEKTANYNEQNLTPQERLYANKNWSSLTGLTWNRWSNLPNKADRDFYLGQRLKKDSKAYEELHSQSSVPGAAP